MITEVEKARNKILYHLIARESAEMVALFQWAAWNESRFPELKLMFHIPNGGEREKRVAAQLKIEGVKAGVPDICLPVKRGGYGSLWIELKRRKGGSASAAQKWWMNELENSGQYADICYGWEEAVKTIVEYLEMEK